MLKFTDGQERHEWFQVATATVRTGNHSVEQITALADSLTLAARSRMPTANEIRGRLMEEVGEAVRPGGPLRSV